MICKTRERESCAGKKRRSGQCGLRLALLRLSPKSNTSLAFFTRLFSQWPFFTDDSKARPRRPSSPLPIPLIHRCGCRVCVALFADNFAHPCPVVIIVAVLILVSAGIWIRRRVRRDIQATTTIAAASTATTSGAAGQPEARRPRRNRRRASQISTKSLPAYMEDADESEVVLVRQAALVTQPFFSHTFWLQASG